MIIRNLFYAAVLTLLLPCKLFAWGRVGHQMIAKLAIYQLSEETQQKVLQVLGTMTPEQAGTWMDDVRGQTAYKYTAP